MIKVDMRHPHERLSLTTFRSGKRCAVTSDKLPFPASDNV
ncbi:hypothetical protein A4U88_2134 [Serratia marcescens]|nr:hypothetical protein A4U88_2134 [Serratia marcescens]AXK22450.1 Hypothetical protein SmN45_0625 [Serratia marcescens]